MEILILVLLILLNGIFSMSEIALVSSRKFKLTAAAQKGNANAKRALKLANEPNTFLSTVQIGITLIGILTGIYGGEKLTYELQPIVDRFEVLRPYSESMAMFLVVLIITYFSIVFGELIPKKIGLIFPEKIAGIVSAPMVIISYVAKPFIWLLSATNDFFFRIFGIKNDLDGIISEEEIKAIVQDSAERGVILNIEQDIVTNVFSLGDRKVRDLMTHRTDISWLDIKDDLKTVKTRLRHNPHSVYPVADKKLDQLIGLVFAKDLFAADLQEDHFQLKEYTCKPAFVQEMSPAYKVLEEFKRTHLHHAIVLDEYGAIEGIISVNDIIDALVGDDPDPNDENEHRIIRRDARSWLVDGQFPFHEFLNYFELKELDESGSFTTVGGLILSKLNHIPKEGEKIEWRGYVLEVADMDDMRIDKILVSHIDPVAFDDEVKDNK